MRIYSQDKAMEFVIENCAILIVKGRKQKMTEWIEQPKKKKEKIRTLGVKENYKYLGILEDERKKLRWIPLENEKITRNHSS